MRTNQLWKYTARQCHFYTPNHKNTFTKLTSTLSLTSIPPSLSSSSCLWMCRSASRLKRSASPMHGGITMRQGSAGDTKRTHTKKRVQDEVHKQLEEVYTMITCQEHTDSWSAYFGVFVAHLVAAVNVFVCDWITECDVAHKICGRPQIKHVRAVSVTKNQVHFEWQSIA